MHCVKTTTLVLRKILLFTQLEQAIEKGKNSANSPTVDIGGVMILFSLWKHSICMSGRLYEVFLNSSLNSAAWCHIFCSFSARLKSFYSWKYSITHLIPEKVNEVLAIKKFLLAAVMMAVSKGYMYFSV